MANNNNNSSTNNIGALWLHESQKEFKYMKGIINIDGNKIPIVIFRNKNKQKDRHPHYIINKDERAGNGN